ncbi:type VI secretion system baseplate subunit TssG [Piscirickettsia litoralis]|uniref:Uncharacterized protein n=1 Tax=Piscirickettsia litoralis TaxID=1891921 RepID=A0ABX3A0X0_9GAMM|nr:type VI secretion system baseplate subunit TssG [Piscirickettsia litoralis]ODN42514.1 hypothetical protein BGC07_05720 [Piscirickettsia litoralis]
MASLIAAGKSKASMCFFIKSLFSFESVSFEDFILSYVDIGHEFRACLGLRNSSLQVDSYIGSKKKSYQSMVYINIICKNSEDFYPGAQLTAYLFKVIKQLIRSPVSFEVYMTDSKNSCNQAKLGVRKTALGWNSVIFSNENEGGRAIKKKLILKAR